MALSLMIFSLVNRYFLVFAISTILGILAWEITIFLVPAWFLTRDRLKGAILVVAAVLVLFIPRWVFPPSHSLIEQLTSQFNGGLWHLPFFYTKTIVASWGFLWVLAPIGLWLMPKDKFASLAVPFTILLVGAFFYSAIATDTFRYFHILAPVFAISCAQLYAELFKNKAHIFGLSILAALVIAQAFDSVPNILFGDGSWVLRREAPTILLTILGIIYGLGAAFVLLFQELREKLPQIDIWFRSPAS